ncbi:hypothetical protein COV42_03065 [Candidatus Campbellbacteria bacterium CG11_big_fil_rev_8_21_14_0_20_44_21]|uniref:Uncharacterized protein n=1 Tax=Candidatus Campbellbacteria bacterium CG22_combo_CG10-13_8_21_14_all_43_18 TaxID=1974530 RepID=A0A2H0DWK5_9BACT|nr:MAG: hypothetical protein COW82_01350 [Candidatus Campbellbacteria bacterium CG22_combo_CG10-13_8_21_14_all_43_18]PIR24030.1 MAG: hypothetical protein COV42_03065 [Candidatus Campbellbacteria bacterium CG11_big_fil_rev_8_21_14_0_20_44_21]
MKYTFDAKTAWLFIVSILIAFSLLEFGLRYWLSNYAPEHLFARYATYEMIQEKPLRYSRHPYLSFYPTPNYTNEKGERHNSLGYRGEEIIQPKPDGVYRVVAIGGSTTYTAAVSSYKDAYPYLLEKELKKHGLENVEVINAGVPFYDSWPILVNFQFRVLDLDPDLIIYYEGDNEIKTRMVYPHESYRGDNTGRVSPPSITGTRIYDTSVALRMIFSRFADISHFGDLSKLNSAETLVHFDYLNQYFSGEYPKGIFKEKSALEILEDNPPIYTERNLRNLVSVAKKQGVDVLFSTYAYSPLKGERTETPVYQKAVEEHNSLIEDIAKREKILFYDFASEMSREPRYWITDGVHVNEAGSALKAELFADFLTPLLAGPNRD